MGIFRGPLSFTPQWYIVAYVWLTGAEKGLHVPKPPGVKL